MKWAYKTARKALRSVKAVLGEFLLLSVFVVLFEVPLRELTRRPYVSDEGGSVDPHFAVSVVT